jgi:hypothetical protein
MSHQPKGGFLEQGSWLGWCNTPCALGRICLFLDRCDAVLVVSYLVVILFKPASVPRQQAFIWGNGGGLMVQEHKCVSGCLKAANNLGSKGGVSGGTGQLGNNLEVLQHRLVTAGAAQTRGCASLGSRRSKHPKCPRLEGKQDGNHSGEQGVHWRKLYQLNWEKATRVTKNSVLWTT